MSGRRYTALAIGGSAGSIPVITRLLENVAADSALTIVICVHTASPDIGDLCSVLARHCALPVEEACEREPIRAGRVYVAGGGYHLLVERAREFALCAGERVHFVRPSIDVLFESMADAYHETLAAMLLSGANADGARGLRSIQLRGGLTFIQCPATASAAEMPQSALNLFAPDRQETPEQLGLAIRELTRPPD